MPDPEQPPEIKWAEFPQRSCRVAFSMDGLIDHTCDLPEFHPGPDAAKSSRPSIERREGWEAANPGWEKTVSVDDPFAGVEEQLKKGR